ncbi:sulfite exporter TauE/SafE family protein [Desulfuromonas sp. TF]|uniref:sulfite exporter TauE/SafE family protein n=1 Tax=Desulfuromonas sp. TF TaxID=1232410 RepID=UPI000400DDEE|nr:sulfite exporter TauE/SafE family protein [Desulfuromonas sp. TF]
MSLPFALQAAALFAIGAFTGVVNVLAGGGSLLTLPLLIFFGLPATVANGTNRVGIVFQSVTAIGGFRRQKMLPVGLALLCTAPAVAGSLLGARLAVDIDDALFQRILALIMIGVLAFMVLDPMKKHRIEEVHFTPLRTGVLLVSFFVIGIYGGFVQAGVGFLIITGLLAHGLDLVRINAVKVFVTLVFTVAALSVFVAHSQVDWPMGLALAAGNATGGWIGTRVAVKKGHDWIKKVVSLTVLVFALKLLFG